VETVDHLVGHDRRSAVLRADGDGDVVGLVQPTGDGRSRFDRGLEVATWADGAMGRRKQADEPVGVDRRLGDLGGHVFDFPVDTDPSKGVTDFPGDSGPGREPWIGADRADRVEVRVGEVPSEVASGDGGGARQAARSSGLADQSRNRLMSGGGLPPASARAAR